MNLSEQLIKSGFMPKYINRDATDFNPNSNWMGVSIYNPDVYFDKGDKTVHLSAQGFGMPTPNPVTSEFMDLVRGRNARYIGFSINKQKVYQNWNGVPPSAEFVNDFVK